MNRVDVIVEYPVHYSTPPRRGVGKGLRQTLFAARQLGADSDETEVRNQQLYLFLSLEAEV